MIVEFNKSGSIGGRLVPGFLLFLGKIKRSTIHEWNMTNLLKVDATPKWTPPLVWVPPPVEWNKLNFDGAFNLNDQTAGCSGIIRNHSGLLGGY